MVPNGGKPLVVYTGRDALHRSWFALPDTSAAGSTARCLFPCLPPVTRAFVALQLTKWSGGKGKHTALTPAYSGVLPVNVLVGKHLLAPLLGIPLQHLPCFMLEVGNQPKDNLCF